MATEACDFKLVSDIAGSCDKPQIQGVENTAYLANYDDIDFDSIVYDTDNKLIVQTLPLKSGKKAYKCVIPGKTPFTGTQTEFVSGTYRNKFKKTAKLVVLDSGPDVVRDIINPLANGKFVFIMENKYKGKDDKNTFEIYGLEQGLSQSEGSQPKYSDDYDGGWDVTLVEDKAASAGYFLFNKDIKTTRAALESMLTGTTTTTSTGQGS